jgi:vacuolar-type H+-ATPase subunit E/Vma4
MGLQAILDAIRTSGEAQLRELETRADIRVREILAKADAEAHQAREESFAKAAAPAGRERARILHRADLEGLRIVGNVREDLVTATLDQTRGRLANIRSEYCYPAVLHKLVEESLAELDDSTGADGKIQLQADPRDQALLSRILSGMGLTFPVYYVLNTWGGLTARSEEGQIVVVNTLEARLERAIPYLRRFLAAGYEDAKDKEETSSDIGEEHLAMS